MKYPKLEVRLKGRIEMHLGGGYTKVALPTKGDSLIEVPTASIPEHLRAVGSTVLVVSKQTDEIVKVGDDEFYRWGEKEITDFREDEQ